ncbi:glutaredoxin-like protein NrdH [Rhizobium laguerreae]|uniref:glutaredoxin-like protein NrdH n=1 Tax=Rhizobium laguerreae TaxID=1076926 RepID=UPI001C90526E|nr:glutaredoxin-like protein NrdH [Rhizobium laguerreae]MBY3151278.1 glutaredoxin-like protein NrdH [Rhizobium laguerreae]MBY3433470.1 glutaredoxin-like protein NrdH [Rhizobium laguerreae]
MEVVVYSTPSCVQCKQTYRELDKKGIAYKVVDLSVDEAAMSRVRGLGYAQAPVVEVGADNMWQGFRPDLIKKLAA